MVIVLINILYFQLFKEFYEKHENHFKKLIKKPFISNNIANDNQSIKNEWKYKIKKIFYNNHSFKIINK
jgi:hypothetical protein